MLSAPSPPGISAPRGRYLRLRPKNAPKPAQTDPKPAKTVPKPFQTYQNRPKTSQKLKSSGCIRCGRRYTPGGSQGKDRKAICLQRFDGFGPVPAWIRGINTLSIFMSGYLKAVWPVFLRCFFEVWSAPGARKTRQICGGWSTPHFCGVFRAPGACQTSKTHPKKSSQIAFRYPFNFHVDLKRS